MHTIFLLMSYLILFFTQSIYAMDKKPSRHITRSFATKEDNTQQAKSERIRPTFSKKELSPLSPISNSDPIISHSCPKKTDDDLVDAIRRQDLKTVQRSLKNFENNPNLPVGIGKNTPLHQAVLLKYEKIAYALLACPSINSLIKNQDGLAAYQLIIDKDIKKYSHLHHELRLRAILDHIIHAMIMTKPQTFIDTCCSDKTIEKKIVKLKTRINVDTLPSYATNSFMMQMIRLRLKYDLQSIKLFLDTERENPNRQDEWNNTFLHYAAYLHDKNLITQLIINPHINSLIRNSDGILAQQLISAQSPQGPELRLMLFARNSLDSIIKKEALGLFILNPTLTKLSPDDSLVIATITNIKNYFHDIEKAQESDRQLPKDSHLPPYAHDQFIFEMLGIHIKKLQLTEEVIILDFKATNSD